MVFNKSPESLNLVIFADANWINEKDVKFTSGVLFKLFGNKIYWRSSRQDKIAFSTAETEIMAFTDAVKEARYLDMHLNQELKLGIKLPINIYEYNEICIAILNHPKQLQHSEHPFLKGLACKKCITEGATKTASINSKDMTADMPTKVLPRTPFLDLKKNLSLIQAIALPIVECC